MALPHMLVAGGVVGGLLFYVFGFIFIHGSAPAAGSKHHKWINETCAPEGLHISVFTWGYFKSSFRRFSNYYKNKLLGTPVASAGKAALDARLVDLQGNEKSLLRDYILRMPKGKPLFLNMGSYT